MFPRLAQCADFPSIPGRQPEAAKLPRPNTLRSFEFLETILGPTEAIEEPRPNCLDARPLISPSMSVAFASPEVRSKDALHNLCLGLCWKGGNCIHGSDDAEVSLYA